MALEKVPGAESAHVDLQSKRASVHALTKATAAAGLPSTVK
jgi:hypothetical protein